MKQMTLSRQLARHITSRPSMTPEVSSWMKLLLLDYFAVTTGGATRDSAHAVRSAASISTERTAHYPAALHGAAGFAPVEDAALVNGVTAHGLELDDTFEESSLHPGVVVFPAVLAIADRDGQSVDAVLTAAAIGYDVMCSVGVLLGARESYARGFHPTGVAGVLGAAAAVAALLDLDENQSAHALGLAANMAAGSLEFLSDGSWTKRLNAGHAAATGIRAAKLATAGFNAPETALEGRDGFLRQYGAGLVEGRELRLAFGRGALDTSIKFYPCCRYMHGNIDLLRDIHTENPGLAPEDVTSIRVAVIKAGAALISEPADRKLTVNSPVDAQFNMVFGAAIALSTGQATVGQFDDAPQVAHDVREWMQKVTCYSSETLEAAFPARWQAEVCVELADGKLIEKSAAAFRGAPQDRAKWADIVAKAEALIGGQPAATLAASIDRMDDRQPISGAVVATVAVAC